MKLIIYAIFTLHNYPHRCLAAAAALAITHRNRTDRTWSWNASKNANIRINAPRLRAPWKKHAYSIIAAEIQRFYSSVPIWNLWWNASDHCAARGLLHLLYAAAAGNRAMALCLILMTGRLGAMVGSNVVGVLLTYNCELIFIVMGGLLIGEFWTNAVYFFRTGCNSFFF